MGTEETIATDSTPEKIKFYMRLRLSMLYARFLFGLLVFNSLNIYMALRIFELDTRFFFRLLVFTPEENYIRGASVIRTLYKILLRTIGFYLEAS